MNHKKEQQKVKRKDKENKDDDRPVKKFKPVNEKEDKDDKIKNSTINTTNTENDDNTTPKKVKSIVQDKDQKISHAKLKKQKETEEKQFDKKVPKKHEHIKGKQNSGDRVFGKVANGKGKGKPTAKDVQTKIEKQLNKPKNKKIDKKVETAEKQQKEQKAMEQDIYMQKRENLLTFNIHSIKSLFEKNGYISIDNITSYDTFYRNYSSDQKSKLEETLTMINNVLSDFTSHRAPVDLRDEMKIYSKFMSKSSIVHKKFIHFKYLSMVKSKINSIFTDEDNIKNFTETFQSKVIFKDFPVKTTVTQQQTTKSKKKNESNTIDNNSNQSRVINKDFIQLIILHIYDRYWLPNEVLLSSMINSLNVIAAHLKRLHFSRFSVLAIGIVSKFYNYFSTVKRELLMFVLLYWVSLY
ncbi:villin [Tieghemostelium lacteum]|uniref:Villin n=1 Tax=Tieghemostelium lacteum TaxID=361077 RepID=A0A151ZG60_TIELA|nr:villin [Tieghemostelium lacteum]|eukprot:KYQ92958.1 villin [Tieghemostelium lacteum]